MDIPSRKRPAADPGNGGGDSALYRSLLSIVAKSLAASRQKVADGAPATIRESYGDMTSLFTSGEDGGGVSSLVDLLLGKLDSVHDRFSPESASAPSKLEELLQKQDILPVLCKIEAAVAAVEKEERDFAAAEEADRQSAKEAIKLAKSTKVEPDGKKRRVMPAESIGYHAHKLKAEYQASLAKELEEVQRENATLEGELKEKWGEWEAGLAGVKGALASMETLGGGGD
ncbi:hypothetical protein ACHAXT_006466 [Thalassiosira profunda]